MLLGGPEAFRCRKQSIWRKHGTFLCLALLARGVAAVHVAEDGETAFHTRSVSFDFYQILRDLDVDLSSQGSIDSFQKCMAGEKLNVVACDLGLQEVNPSCAQYANTDRNEGVMRVIVGRILGNDLPPMHGPYQTENNVRYIFQRENMPVAVSVTLSEDRTRVVRSLPHTWIVGSGNAASFAGTFYDPHWMPPRRCQLGMNIGKSELQDDSSRKRILFSRVVVLNRVLESSTWLNLSNFLKQAEFEGIPPGALHHTDRLPHWIHSAATLVVPSTANLMREASGPPAWVTNQNRARNWSIQESLALGATWVMGLDGNIFITQEGYKGAARSFVEADARRKDYLITPYYRVATEDNSELTSLTTTRALFPKMTLNEAQLSVRLGAPILFKHDLAYGYSNKYALLKDLHKYKYNGSDPRWCAAADEGFDYRFSSVNDENGLNERCGYVLRMSYWPQIPRPPETVQNGDARARLRMTAVRVLCRRVWDALHPQRVTGRLASAFNGFDLSSIQGSSLNS